MVWRVVTGTVAGDLVLQQKERGKKEMSRKLEEEWRFQNLEVTN